MNTLPNKISKYQIKSILGQGAMGVVYLGFDPQIERKVAIKTIAMKQGDDQPSHDLATRFVQEAKLLAKCTHPNIVTILDFGQQDDMAYMVMEYIQGQSMKDLLKARISLPLKVVLAWFVQLLKALHTAHQNNIIHRDLKPENILLVNNKTIKLTDFGIAKSDVNDSKTQIGMAVGTPRYMSPEQLFGTAEIQPSTDVYSLFVILFELLAYVPDEEDHESTPLPAINQLSKHNKFNENTLVPIVMQHLILKGLSMTHADRYQDVTSVVKDLKPILATLTAKQPEHVKDVDDQTTGFFTTGTVITQETTGWLIDEQLFGQIRDHLSELMGPMADFIITNALKNAQSHDQFIMQAAEKIDQQTVRETFVDRWRQL